MSPLTREQIARANARFDALMERRGVPLVPAAETANPSIVTLGKLPPAAGERPAESEDRSDGSG